MNLFGKNKNKEEIETLKKNVEDLKDEISELKTNLEKVTEDCDTEISNMKSILKDNEKTYNSLFEKFQEQLLVINNSIRNEKEEKEEKEVESTNSKLNNDHNNRKTDSNCHLYDIKDYIIKEPYYNLQLSGTHLIGGRGKMGFDITDVIDLKKNLQKYHDKGYTCSKLGKIYGIGRGVIERVVWNIEEGNFDELIKQYQNNEFHLENNHRIVIPPSQKVEYKRRMTKNGQLYSMNGKLMPYTIEDIISLKKEINNPKNITAKDVLKNFKIAYNTGSKLIWNIEEGNFDDLINEWEKIKTEKKQMKIVEEKNTHIRPVSPSLHQKFSNDLKLKNGGELYSGNKKLNYTIQDVLLLQERIPDFNNYPTFNELKDGFDMSLNSLRILIWRIEEGYFDDVVQEYLSRRYTYENNFNRLFIDGENTGLNINKCVSIVEVIVNSPNKREVVNKLIKMYPTVDSKYIRIIADNYSNPNLNKVLKREVKKVEKIDNPQKRREAGVFL